MTINIIPGHAALHHGAGVEEVVHAQAAA